MLKIARVVGITFALLLVMAACNPEPVLISRTLNWQPTPTPRPLTAAQVAGLVETQLVNVAGLSVTVSADENGNLVVQSDSALDDAAVINISQTVAGFIELDYTNLDTVTIEAGGSTKQLSASTLMNWYNRDIDDAALLAAATEG